jgi:[ribosomal protein S5]-alanine N-acetyltransferase
MSFEFVTERLRIRPWQVGDRPALEQMVRDPDMMRYITRGRTWADAEVDELLERQARHLQNHGICFGAVELAASGEVIGMVGMQPLDDGQFELGWWIWKEHWRRGYALEAARPFVAHARDVMGLERLVAVIDPPNAASIKVAERLGMTFECIKSAAETIAKRPDIPIAYYGMRIADESRDAQL